MYSQRQFERDVEDIVNKLNDNDTHEVSYSLHFDPFNERVVFYYKDLNTRKRDNSLTREVLMDDIEANGIDYHLDELLP